MAFGTYSAKLQGTSVTAAITLVQVKAPTDSVLKLLRAWISNTDLETSNQLRAQILRKSAAATVTSHTPAPTAVGMPASGAVGGTAATGVNASVEGTDSTVLVDDGFNILNGFLWVPTPDEQIVVPPGGIIALKLASAPAGATVVSAGFVWDEIG